MRRMPTRRSRRRGGEKSDWGLAPIVLVLMVIAIVAHFVLRLPLPRALLGLR